MSDTFPMLYEGNGLFRLMKHVAARDNSCWQWMGYTNPKGYGRMWLNGKLHMAHRASYILNNGHIPDGMHVLHRCDNPSCVNPAHLFIGSNDDNVKDKMTKGRHRPIALFGSANPATKLTDEQVRAIRTEREKGQLVSEIARVYGVSNSLISLICANKARTSA